MFTNFSILTHGGVSFTWGFHKEMVDASAPANQVDTGDEVVNVEGETVEKESLGHSSRCWWMIFLGGGFKYWYPQVFFPMMYLICCPGGIPGILQQTKLI